MPFGQVQIDIDRIGDLLTASHRVLKSWEFVVHLVGRAKKVLLSVHLHSFFVGSKTPSVDAQHDVLATPIVLIDIVTVTGCNQRHADLLCDFD